MSDEQAQAMQQPGVRHESGDLPKSQGKRQSLSVLGTSDNPALIPATRSHGSPASRLKNTPHSHGNASGGNRVAASSHFHVAHPGRNSYIHPRGWHHDQPRTSQSYSARVPIQIH